MGLRLFLDCSVTRSFFQLLLLLVLLDLQPLQLLLFASLPLLISGGFLGVAQDVSSLVLLLREQNLNLVKSRLISGDLEILTCSRGTGLKSLSINQQKAMKSANLDFLRSQESGVADADRSHFLHHNGRKIGHNLHLRNMLKKKSDNVNKCYTWEEVNLTARGRTDVPVLV